VTYCRRTAAPHTVRPVTSPWDGVHAFVFQAACLGLLAGLRLPASTHARCM